jgi:hypothetical protein
VADLAGSVIVHDRYAAYDSAALGPLVHQLCCQHYPDTVVMPIPGVPVLVGGGDRVRDIGIIGRAVA